MKSIVLVTALSATQVCAAPSADCNAMRDDLPRMAAIDQAVRELVQPQDLAISTTDASEAPKSVQRMATVDRAHERRLAFLVRRCGWPRRSAYGDEVVHSAWLLVQHSSHSIQKEFLPLLRTAAENGEVSGSDVAYLTDRVRVESGQPQLYGTQLDIKPPCVLSFYPIEDMAGVDDRRAKMGLPSLTVYEAAVREHFEEKGCQSK